jgi:hypothetical protein
MLALTITRNYLGEFGSMADANSNDTGIAGHTLNRECNLNGNTIFEFVRDANHFRNDDPDLGGVGGWGRDRGRALCGRTGLDFIGNPTSTI